MRKDMVKPDRPQMKIKYGAEKVRFASRMTKARIHPHTHNIYYLLPFQPNNGYANAPPCYVIRTLPISFTSPAAQISTVKSVVICRGR